MRARVDTRLRDEAARLCFRFACEDCVHFDAARTRCVHEYPASPLRAELEGDHISFCKEFELGA